MAGSGNLKLWRIDGRLRFRQPFLQKGIKAMQAGEYEDAGTFFKKAIKENDERAEYYIAYGMYLNEQGEYEEAVKQFERAYQDTENTIANVNNKQVYLGEAIAYTHLQKYEKALSLCKRALKLTNTASLDNRIWCSEGVVLEALNRPDEALTAYRNAVKGNKENWQAYFRMGVIYQNNGDSDAAGQAQEYLLSASQKGDREAGYYLGMLYLEQQDKVKAKKYLEKYTKTAVGNICLTLIIHWQRLRLSRRITVRRMNICQRHAVRRRALRQSSSGRIRCC